MKKLLLLLIIVFTFSSCDTWTCIECSEKNLIDFSIMGASLFKALYPDDKAKVALLNIGSEEAKGNETIKILQDNLITNNSINVFESHAFEISKLPNVLIPIGKSDNCNYEIIQYEKKLIFGTQFHPEMSLDGNNLIEKFCSL